MKMTLFLAILMGTLVFAHLPRSALGQGIDAVRASLVLDQNDWDSRARAFGTFCKTDKQGGFCQLDRSLTKEEIEVLIELFDQATSYIESPNPNKPSRWPFTGWYLAVGKLLIDSGIPQAIEAALNDPRSNNCAYGISKVHLPVLFSVLEKPAKNFRERDRQGRVLGCFENALFDPDKKLGEEKLTREDLGKIREVVETVYLGKPALRESALRVAMLLAMSGEEQASSFLRKIVDQADDGRGGRLKNLARDFLEGRYKPKPPAD